jgi:integrase
LADAVEDQLLDSNPAVTLKAVHGRSPKLVAPSVEQFYAFLDDLSRHAPDLVELAELLATTGIRRSEALGLRWKDVDLVRGSMSIKQRVTESEEGGKWEVRPGAKSEKSARTFPIAPEVVAVLRRQQTRVKELRLRIGRLWRDHDLIFPSLNGTVMLPMSVTAAFGRAAGRVNWPEHCTPVHGLRHFAATQALANGASITAVSVRLGHASAAITLRIYAHVIAAQEDAASEAMARVLRR